jgi:uncharacterized membrane protein
MRGCFLALVLFFLLMVPSCPGREPRVDQQTGQIRVLFMGDALMEAGFVTPLVAQDPLVRLSPVPVEFVTMQYASIEEAATRLRMYVPRTERHLQEGYDVVIIADARAPFFPSRLQLWIKNGVLNTGMGLLMAGGPQSFGGTETHPSWGESFVGDVLPCLCPPDYWELGRIYFMVPTAGYEDHPLVRNIPWERIPLGNHQRVEEREGTKVVARSDRNPPGSPILMYMEMGQGMSEAFVYDWGGNGPQEFHRSSYAPVIMSNLIYYIAGVEIPEDTSLFLLLRTRLTSFFGTRSYAISVMDFAEKFNANLRKAEAALKEADELRKEVIQLYVKGEYEESLVSLGEGLELITEVSNLALTAKDEALVWVYVIEWFTVTSAAMISGVILWTLMIRRAAYRDVGVTRFNM